MLQSITAQVDIRLGIIISVLSAIPVLTVIYVSESAKFAGFRQKWTDRARQFVRLAASRLHGANDLAHLAIVRLGNHRGVQ